jgi:hypothetical protein
LVVLSCTPQTTSPTPPPKTKTAAASTQAAPTSKQAPRALVHVSLGSTAQTLDILSKELPWIITSKQLTTSLERELQGAVDDLDLTQGSEALLGFSSELLGFVNFSFALKKEHRITEKLKTTPGVDTKGHQFALRPLPGSPLSPFNRVLYLDVKAERLFVSDQPDGLAALPLQSGLATPTLRASIDFASLWFVFGVPYQEAYIAKRQEEGFKAENNSPKARQGDVFWESVFRLADMLYRVELEIETGDGVLVSALVSTKQKFDAKLEPLGESQYQIVANSQFGFKANLPKVVVKTIAEARQKLAPPAFDSLALFYPLANAMSGGVTFGGGIDNSGFWSVGQYSLSDAAMARLQLRKFFSAVPQQGANFLEEGRSFVFLESKAKTVTGANLDFVTSTLVAPTEPEKLLQIHDVKTRYEISPTQAIVSLGKSGEKNAALLSTPQKLPQPLISLLEKRSSARPSTEALPMPFFLGWFSSEAIENLNAAPASVAATVAQQEDKLLLRIAFLP